MATSTIKKNFYCTDILTKTASEIGGTTGNSFSCGWQNYDMLLMCARHYTNIRETSLIPVSYFATTSSGARAMIFDSNGNIMYECYQNGSGSVYVKSTSQDAQFRFTIFGLKF